MTITRNGSVTGLLHPVAAFMLFLAACGDGSSGDGAQSGGQPEVRDPNQPGVFEIGPGRYEVVIVAFEGGFDPSEVRVPAGAEVRFRVRSVDLSHGFMIVGTDVEVAVDPFSPGEATYTFAERGEYGLQCHIYCGGGHPAMLGTVIVE
jgi:heme/copper-type cytochrome/quinol oxidase subunit 2